MDPVGGQLERDQICLTPLGGGGAIKNCWTTLGRGDQMFLTPLGKGVNIWSCFFSLSYLPASWLINGPFVAYEGSIYAKMFRLARACFPDFDNWFFHCSKMGHYNEYFNFIMRRAWSIRLLLRQKNKLKVINVKVNC